MTYWENGAKHISFLAKQTDDWWPSYLPASPSGVYFMSLGNIVIWSQKQIPPHMERGERNPNTTTQMVSTLNTTSANFLNNYDTH